MLEERAPASASDSRTSAFGQPGTGGGPRSARKRRGLFHRTGIIVPAVGVAAVLVAMALVAAYLVPKGNGPKSLFGYIDSLGHSNSVALLVQERETIIAMDAATQTLTVDSKPATANPQQLLADAAASSSSSSTGGGTGIVGTPPPADPTAAEKIGESELVSFGFSESTQWPCLYNLWERESGWNVYAENPTSGAYGIPQSLPGDKMASVGSDWQTNPRTQIIWGLGYIKSVYGTPCGAWQNELNYGSY